MLENENRKLESKLQDVSMGRPQCLFRLLQLGLSVSKSGEKNASWACSLNSQHSHHHHAFQSKAVFGSQYEMMGLSPVFAEAIGDTSSLIKVRPTDLWKVKGIWWCDETRFLPGIIDVESPWVRPAWTCTKQDESLLKMHAMTCATNRSTSEQNTYYKS